MSSNKKTYGPHMFHETDEEASKLLEQKLRIREKDYSEYLAGNASYADVLYADPTPCSIHYKSVKEILKKHPRAKAAAEIIKQDVRVHAFQKCVKKYEAFYLKRQEMLDEMLDKKFMF